MFTSKDKLFMKRAINLAMESFAEDEVPVGAVTVSYTHLTLPTIVGV